MTADNPNCDGSGPHAEGDVRKLPTGGGANAILCAACFGREMKFRRERNRDLDYDVRFDLPTWYELEIYGN